MRKLTTEAQRTQRDISADFSCTSYDETEFVIVLLLMEPLEIAVAALVVQFFTKAGEKTGDKLFDQGASLLQRGTGFQPVSFKTFGDNFDHTRPSDNLGIIYWRLGNWLY
ncbi:MAG: hypothetical protein F6J86_20470 [Symploca sp. SIO1B1]|nr:hypothetical protein [Symploca sp. SIO2D2]NER25166.1 hypothetical protein [Symploca sp. SIO1C2]NER96186.1 hypothetical protein [Symploca sp. SIO1B1]